MPSARTTALVFALLFIAGARANDAPHKGLLPGVGTPEHHDQHTSDGGDADPPTPPPKPLPSCSDANNCFDCFLQQECYNNPLGEPWCEPCGWCASNHSNFWDADVVGECVVAAISVIDFCQIVDPGADRYCPESVCKVGDWGCACKDNVCPAVERLLGVLSLEGLVVLCVILTTFSICLIAVCLFAACRSQPQKVVVVNFDASHGATTLPLAAEATYARMA